jgi:hypothetical protein
MHKLIEIIFLCDYSPNVTPTVSELNEVCFNFLVVINIFYLGDKTVIKFTLFEAKFNPPQVGVS